jgi:hypothetical protein
VITDLIPLIPHSVLDRSGAVFNTGRTGFSSPSPIYLLGVNPGGNPEEHRHETVASQTEQVLRHHPAEWSAFADASWRGRAPGTCGMQPRVLHLIAALGLDARRVPASNLVFARSAGEDSFEGNMVAMAHETWPFHQAVIKHLGVRVVVCFGQTAGNFVRGRLGAHQEVDTFIEDNRRGWRSTLHQQPGGIHVATLSHPSKAKWSVPQTDPSALVKRALASL